MSVSPFDLKLHIWQYIDGIVHDRISTLIFAMPFFGFSVRGFLADAFYLDSPKKNRSLMISETVFLSCELYIFWVINKHGCSIARVFSFS